MNIAFIGMSGNLLNFGEDSRGTIKRRCEREDSDEEREQGEGRDRDGKERRHVWDASFA